MNIRVDTLEFSNLLEEAGMERAHAEAIAKLQARTVALVEQNLVTKTYFDDHLKSELTQLEARVVSMLRDAVRSQPTSLRDEIRNRCAARHQQMDALMQQIRTLQYGIVIAAFAISVLVLLPD